MTESGAPLRVLVADDHPAFRRGLVGMLGTVPGIAVVGQAPDGQACVEAAAALRPDVVIMDLHMPVLDGIAATRRITAADPDIAVVVVTMLEDDESVFAALRAGARGYVLKGADQDDILRAVRAVADGDVIFGGVVAEQMLTHLTGAGAVTPRAFPQLTAREVEVLELIARGQRNRQIAESLVLTEKTVRNHVSNIFAKLHVADRSEVIVRAREAGLGKGGGATAPRLGM